VKGSSSAAVIRIMSERGHIAAAVGDGQAESDGEGGV